MNPSLSKPFVSVLIRSYNRLPHVLEIVDVCLNQDYENFEIVIVDQSAEAQWEENRTTFESKGDKVRIIRSDPLGSAGAKNVGVANSKGDVVLFIDDDDLPVGHNWIRSHAKHYEDPHCIGVSGRCIKQLDEKVPYKNQEMAYDRCLTYSFFLRGRDFTGIDRPKKTVEWLHGLNASVRRSYVVELGGWYPFVPNIDEHSFCFKLQKVMQDGDYLMFDPEPVVLRRFDIPGGLGKRYLSLNTVVRNHLKFYHWVVAEQFPLRFYGLYPLFIIYAFRFAVRWFKTYSFFTDSRWMKWFGPGIGRRLYIWQEFFRLPFTALRLLLARKPAWSGRLENGQSLTRK